MAAPKKAPDPLKINVRGEKVDSSLIENPATTGTQAAKRTGAHPETVRKVEECAKMIANGKGREEIINYMVDTYGYSYDYARRYYIAGCHFLIPDDQPEFKAGLIKQNIERLEKIINDCIEEKNYKVAKEAIDTLNRTLGVYERNNGIIINQDPDSGQQQIIVNFG